MGIQRTSGGSVLIAWCGVDSCYSKRAESLAADIEAASEASGSAPAICLDMVSAAGSLSTVARSVFSSLVGSAGEAALLARLLQSNIESMKDVPALAVALDPLAASILAIWRESGALMAPVVGFCDRLPWDPRWTRCCDFLGVLDQKQRSDALEAAYSDSRIRIVGPWVDVELAAALEAPSRDAVGLSEERPVLLVCAGGIDEDLLGKLLFQLGLLQARFSLVFDVSGEASRSAFLRRRAQLYGVSAHLLTRSERALGVWAVAELAVGRDTLEIEARALQAQIPWVAVVDQRRPRGIGSALKERSLGAAVDSTALLSAEIEMLFGARNSEGFSAYHRQLSVLEAAGRPGIIAECLALRQELMERRDPNASADGRAESGQPDTDSPSGLGGEAEPVLEAIGPRARRGDSDGAEPDEVEFEVAQGAASRLLLEQQQHVQRWQQRLELARERDESELVQEAELTLEHHRRAMHASLAELADLDRRRQQRPRRRSKEAERGLEKQFRKMDLDDALADLKSKMAEDEAS